MNSQKALIEGILFASPHPVSSAFLTELLEAPPEEIDQALRELKAEYETDNHGFLLVEVASGYQFRTKPELKELMARFYQKKPPRLTQATLEVLSVVAYKQPITRPQIEKIRGVDCTAVLKALLERNLIEMRGRSELPGHPVVYGTSEKFLEWFQIKNLADLPPLSEMEVLASREGLEAGSETLLGLLRRDDGYQIESVGEMDETLKQLAKKPAPELELQPSGDLIPSESERSSEVPQSEMIQPG